jgi:hypothetical protein
MKKSYMKPILTFESLDISANIASGCAFISTTPVEYTCPVEDPETGWTIFSDPSACMMNLRPGDTICYDIPLANANVFSS